MKDFDSERGKLQRDLQFVAGGETFTVIAFVPPEHLNAFQPTQHEGKQISEVYDEWIVSMLVDEDKPKWAKVREKAEPPLSLHDIEQVVFWLVEVATGRPTVRPSRSPSGPQAPTAGSGATSSSGGKVTPVPTF